MAAEARDGCEACEAAGQALRTLGIQGTGSLALSIAQVSGTSPPNSFAPALLKTCRRGTREWVAGWGGRVGRGQAGAAYEPQAAHKPASQQNARVGSQR